MNIKEWLAIPAGIRPMKPDGTPDVREYLISDGATEDSHEVETS